MRLKIIAGNLVAVLLLGVIAFVVVRTSLKTRVSQEIESQISNDQLLLDRSWRLSALEFVNRVDERATIRQVRDVFNGLDENSKRTRGFEAMEATAAWFGDPARGSRGAPDIALVTDETGKVLARNVDRNRMFGIDLAQSLPTLRRVLAQGDSIHDVWLNADEGKVLQVAASPIRNDAGGVIGALVVAYDVSNGLAQSEGRVLGRDVAFVTGGKVYSSSLPSSAADDLKAYLFGEAQAQTTAAMAEGATPTSHWAHAFGGDEYVGVTAPLPMSPSLDIGYVVLADRTKALEVSSSINIVLILTVIFSLLVLGYGFFIGTSLLRPIEEIEEGVLAVINGRTDLRLDVKSAELGGLAYRINQLLNVFTGVQEGESDDDDGRISHPPEPSAWGDAAFADGAAAGASASGASAGGADPLDDPAVAAQLAAEPEDQYYARIFKEYVGAKQALGENVGNIPQDKFTQRMQGNAQALAQKHGCKAVRFQVHTRGNQVILRPVLIR